MVVWVKRGATLFPSVPDGFAKIRWSARNWAASSVVERLVYTEDVGSSTLSPPTIFSSLRQSRGCLRQVALGAFVGIDTLGRALGFIAKQPLNLAHVEIVVCEQDAEAWRSTCGEIRRP